MSGGRGPLLSVDGIRVAYGKVPVLNGVSLFVARGEIVALVGPNGAGKTTTFKSIMGLLPLVSGTIHSNGMPLHDLSVAERVRRGIAIVPEGRRLFLGLTVEENLLVGGEACVPRKQLEVNAEQVYGLFPELAEHRRALAGLLSGGQQQMCAIGRAMMASPHLLLVDELSLGLSPQVADRVAESIGRLAATGVSVIVVDQDMERALEMADRAYVLRHGFVDVEGDARQLLEAHDMRVPFLRAREPP